MLAAAVATLVSPATAQDRTFPYFEIETVIEVQNDFAFDSDDPDLELNDFFTKTEPAIALFLTENLSIQSGLVIEPLFGPGPQDDRFFEDHGLFAEALTINFDTDHF